MFGQVQAQLHAAQNDLRKQAGDQDSRQQAGQRHEQQIIAGVERGQRDDENSGQVDDALARHAIVHAIGQPSQGRAPRQHRDHREGHPGGERQRAERGKRRGGGAPIFGGHARVERQQQRGAERDDGNGEGAPGGPVDLLSPEFPFGRGVMLGKIRGSHRGYSGTGVESRISERMASACATFFWVVA